MSTRPPPACGQTHTADDDCSLSDSTCDCSDRRVAVSMACISWSCTYSSSCSSCNRCGRERTCVDMENERQHQWCADESGCSEVEWTRQRTHGAYVMMLDPAFKG